MGQFDSTPSWERKTIDYSKKRLESRVPTFYEGVVVSNSTVLQEGYIKVALVKPTNTPAEWVKGQETEVFKFHRNVSMLKKTDGMGIKSYNYDDTFTSLKPNIVDCYLGTPFSGSFQNSGWFMCPPVNSRGIVLEIGDDHIWICGVFKPIIKQRDKEGTPTNVFLPFPSNVVETSGIDFEACTNRDLTKKGNGFSISGQDATVSGTSISNPTLIEAGETSVTEDARNIILLRTVYPGGDRIINNETYRGTDFILNDGEDTKLKKEYDSLFYPTESLFEISGKRFWLHKATKWTDEKVLSDFRDDTNQNIIGSNDLRELTWQDFTISTLDGLDKFSGLLSLSPSNETDGLEGIGFSLNDITDSNGKNRNRNLEYDTTTTHTKKLFHENAGGDPRKIELSIVNQDASTIDLLLSKGSDLSITLSIDLDNNSVSLSNKKDSNNEITFTLDTASNTAELESKEASGSNKITLDTNGITIEDKNLNTVEMTNTGIKFTDLSNNYLETKSSIFDLKSQTTFKIAGIGGSPHTSTLKTYLEAIIDAISDLVTIGPPPTHTVSPASKAILTAIKAEINLLLQ